MKQLHAFSFLIAALVFLTNSSCGSDNSKGKELPVTSTPPPPTSTTGNESNEGRTTTSFDINYLKSFFPLNVGAKYIYQRNIVKGKCPLSFYNQKTQYENLEMSGNEETVHSGIEQFEIITKGEKSDEFVVKGEGIEPYGLETLQKLTWAIRESRSGGFIIIHEGREGYTTSSSSALAYLLTDFNQAIEQQAPNNFIKYINDMVGSLTVLGEKYDTVIRCTKNYSAGTKRELVRVERFFAKDVGLIKEVQYNSKNEILYTLELKSFKNK